MNRPSNSQTNFLDVCESIRTEWPDDRWIGTNVLVAVSGGPDSVLLLEGLRHIHQRNSGTGKLIVGHVNHQLRESAPADMTFTAQLAERHQLKFLSENLDLTPSDSRQPSEEFLRQSRYASLLQMADSCGARYVVTGHNQNDQIETALFRIFRGTGVGGLQGIPALRVAGPVSIVRPMLQVPRQKILDALLEIGQTFCRDATNEESNYTRNFLRNEILPELRERFPGLDKSILKLTQQAVEIEQCLDWETDKFSDAVIDINDCEFKIIKSKVKHAHNFIVRHLLMRAWRDRNWPRRNMHHDWWKQLSDLALDQSKRSVLNLPGDIRVENDPQELHFQTPQPPA